LSAPTTRATSSSTSSALILWRFHQRAASTASASEPIGLRVPVMTCVDARAAQVDRGIVQRAAQVAVV
jgi:hypothetical protein